MARLRKAFLMFVMSFMVAAGLIGCHHTLRPGAVNQVDDQLYTSLVDTRAAIEAAKVQAASSPALKAILNDKIIPPFNQAESAYKQYHAALVANQPITTTAAQIAAQLNAVLAALSDALKTGAKP